MLIEILIEISRAIRWKKFI